MQNKLCVAVIGCTGRMGEMLIRAVHETPQLRLSGALTSPKNPHKGQDIGQVVMSIPPMGVTITDQTQKALAHANIILDFSTPETTCRVCEEIIASQQKCVHIIGTTGLTAAQETLIEKAAQQIPVVYSGNMSLGIALLAKLVAQAAHCLDQSFDSEICEMHHRHKVDAPSGTALLLGKAISQARGTELSKVGVFSREGQVGPRKAGDIGFSTLRGGSVVGDHTVIFAGDAERIELTHRAQDRSLFVRGAIKAGLWAMNQNPGLYTLSDVLGL